MRIDAPGLLHWERRPSAVLTLWYPGRADTPKYAVFANNYLPDASDVFTIKSDGTVLRDLLPFADSCRLRVFLKTNLGIWNGPIGDIELS